MDGASSGWGPSISQSITAVSHVGRPGTAGGGVASSQGKHRAYAVSRDLGRNGLHLSDELTPKQFQAQKALGGDAAALSPETRATGLDSDMVTLHKLGWRSSPGRILVSGLLDHNSGWFWLTVISVVIRPVSSATCFG